MELSVYIILNEGLITFLLGTFYTLGHFSSCSTSPHVLYQVKDSQTGHENYIIFGFLFVSVNICTAEAN